ncbi:MAG: ABC transporter substrate-binding protein [Betaproteobacteria bacterium]|nr:ABC transporter substrate-binding protein [Gammaproteobacteria bacterium]MDH3438071.1 ABC transporter substrate-binding protein [Betaproteobacteria bacterium]
MRSPCRIPIFFAAAGLGLALSLAAVAGATELTPQEKKLIPLAKQEGSLVSLISLFQDRTARDLEKAFIKRYGLGEDFKYVNIRKGTGPSVSMARQEIKANRITFDVIMVAGAGFFHGAAQQGAFLKLDSGQWKYSEEGAKKAGAFFQYPYFVVGSAYTFQPVWNATCPGMEGVNIESYADVLNPKFKGKTIASDVTKSSSYSFTTLGLEQAGFDVKGMWKKLKAQDPLVAFRTEGKMQMVINCERPVDMWNLAGRVLQAIEKDPTLAKKLRWGTYKEGQVLMTRQMAAMKGAPHPNAGKLFVEFLLSEEGIDIMTEREVATISYREGYTPPASVKQYALDLKDIKVLGIKDELATNKQFKGMRQEWRKVFQ